VCLKSSDRRREPNRHNMQNSQLSKAWKKKYKEVIKELVSGFADIRLKSTFTSAYTRN
jgi:hypothetical protein